MSEWLEYKVGDICEVGRGSSPRPIADQKYFIGGSIPWVKIADATSSTKYIFKTKQYVNEFGASFSRKLQPGSIILAASGTLGFPMYLGVEACIHDGWLYFDEFKKNRINKSFFFYFLQTLKVYFDRLAYGAAIQNINTGILRNTPINLPPLPTQQKIVKILSYYDDLIEHNFKRIKLLEESARLTYEEWFLRFRVDGKKLEIDPESGLPFGWQNVLLTEYIDLLRGVEPGSSSYEEVKTDSNTPFIRVGDLSKRDSAIYISKELANNKIIDKDDILLSLDGSPGMVKFGLSGCYSTGIRKAVSKQKNISYVFVYNLLNSQYIQGLITAYATGATILHAGSSVKKMRFVMPTDEVLDKYNNIEMKKFQIILNLLDQNQHLKEARDILLPRLMTGMIDTDKLEMAA